MHQVLISILAVAALAATAIQTPALAGPDQGRGMALMSALVAANGYLAADRSSGAVSASRNGTGSYSVKFVRQVYGCVPIAEKLETPGHTLIAGPYGDNDIWIVSTYNTSGVKTDSAFNILTFCPR